ncbi:hypothetical protein ACSBM8_11765 [Sphingomonas sp. ASY06-1R]|jgi:hypothetical protein|uniref:hypothetical protein n=1 Tax=Sphingomonas sp. ASY06-1R TaxID=3445771 RepID=UPI003FA1FB14
MVWIFLALAGYSDDPQPLRCRSTAGDISITLPARLDPSIKQIGVERLTSPKQFYIVLDDDVRLVAWTPKMRNLVFNRTQLGVVSSDQGPQKQRIFAQPGRYRIIFADTIETEFDNMTSVDCRITIR